jgi:two-component system sensor kinase FixL
MAIDIMDPLSPVSRAVIVGGCVVAVTILILTENHLGLGALLGGLFFVPLLVSAAYLPRGALFLFAIAIALAREQFGPRPWDSDAPVRVSISLVAFTGGALFAGELIRNGRLTRERNEERYLRVQAEQEARALLDGSPAAMVIVDADCRIIRANQAARQLLGFAVDTPAGDRIEQYIPMLANIIGSGRIAQLKPTMVETRGRHLDGQEVYLNVWVSVHPTPTGPTLSAVLLDVTAQVRDHAEAGLRQLLLNSRVIAGAVSHELRNLASAASILHLNMRQIPGIQSSADYTALGTVIEGARRLSSTELEETSEAALEGNIDLVALLRELRTIIAPEYERCGVRLVWEVAKDIPPVHVDRSGLLQVLLNLARNSRNVLLELPKPQLKITAYALSDSVLIRFADNGPGISSAERLFQPFQPGASSTGLGLFVSRAIVRTWGGELHHTQAPGECCFIIELPQGN